MKTQCILLCAGLVLCAMHVRADVTVNVRTDGKASFINVGGDGVIQIKGKRQRNDQTVGGKTVTSIIDVDGMRFIDLDTKKQSATVTPLATLGEALQKAATGDMQVSLTKTPQTKTVASYPCTVHNVKVTLPFTPTGNKGDGLDLILLLSGTVCLSTTAPGLADYQTFYKSAADSGFIFGDPRVAKSPTGAAQAKAYAALTKQIAEGGMNLESQINISATGDGPMAGMMAKLAASDIRTTVTSVATGTLPAESFDVPAGYKVKTQK
jgi:hypothetical protein